MSSREVKKGMKNSPGGEQQEELKKKKIREILQRWKNRLQGRSFNNIKMQRLERIFHLPFPS